MRIGAIVLLVSLAGLAPGAGRAQDEAAWPRVDPSNANVTLSARDLALAWTGPEFAFARTYNSRLQSFAPPERPRKPEPRRGKKKKRARSQREEPAGPPKPQSTLGPGWRHSFSTRVLAVAGPDALLIEEASGALTTYKRADAKRFVAAVGPTWHFVEAADGGWTRRRKGIAERFDASGKLLSIADGAGRALTLGWSARGLDAVTDSAGRVLQVGNDEAGRIVSLKDPLGRTVSFSYDARGLLALAVDATGASTRYAYDARGHLVGVTAPTGESARIAYREDRDWVREISLQGRAKQTFEFDVDPQDPARFTATVRSEGAASKTVIRFEEGGAKRTTTGPRGEVTVERVCGFCSGLHVVKDPLGRESRHTFTPDGLVHEIVDEGGGITREQFVAQTGLTASRTLPDGGRESTQYDARGQVVARVAADGAKTALLRDAAGELVATLMPDGSRWTTKNDALGRPRELTDPEGRVTRFEWDLAGRLTKKIDADGRASTIEYDGADRVTATAVTGSPPVRFDWDALGRVTTIVDPSGARQRFAYHESGKVSRWEKPGGSVRRFVYDARGFLAKIEREGGAAEKYETDDGGRVVGRVDALGNRTRFGYDEAGQLVSVRDGSGAVVKLKRDPSGRIVQAEDAAGRVTRRRYSPGGRPLSITLPDGSAVRFTYDAAGRTLAQTDAGGRVTRLSYDALGRISKITDAAGLASSFAYDARGCVTAYTDPVLGKTAYTYTPGGQLIASKQADGRVTKVALDEAARKRTITLPDGGAIVTEFDATGRRLEEQGPGYHWRWTYDDAGFPASVADVKAGRMQRYVNDEEGRRRSWTDAEGRATTYRYDDADRLVEIRDRTGVTIKYAYDGAGRRMQREVDGVWKTRTPRDAAGRVIAIEHLIGDKKVFATQATLSANGMIASLTEDGVRTEFGLDAVGRVQRVARAGAVVAEMKFDELDHLVRLSAPKGADGRAVSALGLVQRTPAGPVSAGPGGAVTRESLDGKPVEYAYDALLQLTGARIGGQALTFRYGPDRTWTGILDASGERSFDTDAGRIVAERDAKGRVVSYVHGDDLDEPVAQVMGEDVVYLLTDHLGSVRRRIVKDGTVASAVDYDLFGVPAVTKGDHACVFGFTGRPQETRTGLVNLRLRWLNPRLAQFMTPDLAQFPGRWAYAFGNPVSLTDPLGTGIGSWIAGAAVAAVATAAAVVAAPAIAAGATAAAGLVLASTAAQAVGAAVATNVIVGVAVGSTATAVLNAATGASPADTVKATAVSAVTNGIIGGVSTPFGPLMGAVINTVGQGIGGAAAAVVQGKDAGDVVKSGFNSAVGGMFGSMGASLFGAALQSTAQMAAGSGADDIGAAIGTYLTPALSNLAQGAIDTVIPNSRDDTSGCPSPALVR